MPVVIGNLTDTGDLASAIGIGPAGSQGAGSQGSMDWERWGNLHRKRRIFHNFPMREREREIYIYIYNIEILGVLMCVSEMHLPFNPMFKELRIEFPKMIGQHRPVETLFLVGG